jgi:RND superfamily putative drug exporter
VRTDLLVGVVTFTVVVTLLATSVGLALIVPAGLFVAWLLLLAAELLGDANWWQPRWLDRLLPMVRLDAHETERVVAAPPVPVGSR